MIFFSINLLCSLNLNCFRALKWICSWIPCRLDRPLLRLLHAFIGPASEVLHPQQMGTAQRVAILSGLKSHQFKRNSFDFHPFQLLNKEINFDSLLEQNVVAELVDFVLREHSHALLQANAAGAHLEGFKSIGEEKKENNSKLHCKVSLKSFI